jgi:hypothetical protein
MQDVSCRSSFLQVERSDCVSNMTVAIIPLHSNCYYIGGQLYSFLNVSHDGFLCTTQPALIQNEIYVLLILNQHYKSTIPNHLVLLFQRLLHSTTQCTS